ncbi:hypothetical protein Cgig2_015385 [Carnegiea gigantea]|uniref:Uncharacterized protein n=1 Tax=Carnegiea gigantea TaxID=171969 RepID=A0A9Q1JSN2_9CARY|nr:hypothetical protein Cgig2_015385 [Carnegiea gigantea]
MDLDPLSTSQPLHFTTVFSSSQPSQVVVAPYTVSHSTGASESHIGEEDIRGLIHDTLGSAKMFRFRKSLDKHILQQPCDQNANHIQPHSQHHYLPVDDQGKVLRMQEMPTKDVYRLLGAEKFNMPYTSKMDKVIFDKFGSKFRRVKYRYKNKLLKKAKTKLKTTREESGVYVEHMLQDKARDLVAKKTMELGISKPVDDAAESEIHNAVWKELMEGETSRRPLNYGIGVTKSQITKLNDDSRRMSKRRSSPAPEAKISI